MFTETRPSYNPYEISRESHEILESLSSVVLSPASGDFFQTRVFRLAHVFHLSTVWIAEWKKETSQFQTHALVHLGELSAPKSYNGKIAPCSEVIESKSFFHTISLEDRYPGFESVLSVKGSHYLGYPLKSRSGEIIGVIAILNRKPIPHIDRVIRILELLSVRTAQELERRKSDTYISHAIESVYALSHSLKEIHRLTTSHFESIEDLFSGYLKTGLQLFHFPLGIISQTNQDKYKILKVEGDSKGIKKGDSFRIVDTFFSKANQTKKTVFYEDIFSSEENLQKTPFFKEYGLVKSIEVPILIDGKVEGSIGFFSEEVGGIPIENHFIEVIEVMSRSIAYEIEKREAAEELKKIKLHQDGDYYLTSLLVKPLGGTTIESSNVKIEFLTKQKKEFSFQGKQGEIGGDLSVAHTILLREKKHTVFINADAMGKSLQGAAGALVLGAVFRSIIERTKNREEYQIKYPEQWLREVFDELNKTFESFDYTMLVSLILGLVEDESGLLYFVNAEHPHIILYRDGIASFIKTKYSYLKIGATLPQERFAINIFQLQKGDVLFGGSDGKDDILVHGACSGEHFLNTDEKLFLEHVRRREGNLSGIVRSIQQTGELTDDLSLFRLEYNPESETEEKTASTQDGLEQITKFKQEIRKGNLIAAQTLLESAYELNDRNLEVLQSLVKFRITNKEYEQAVKYGEEYLSLKADSNHILLSLSFAYQKLGKINKAIEYSERLILREPQHLKNTTHLAVLYGKKGDFEKAKEFLNFAIESTNDKEQLEKLEKYLSRIEHVHAKQKSKYQLE
ncbi:GAF domain-containing SpoIIE family protein phosphatase [Leptospira terpstrae]|uniref:Stage II sporulation protein E n=1 Tax=Leptospira terpstrae serovar Hualin str. LT 11-33 = ATCC 700639 TaxID=1257025 RepID=N1VNN6_9LEPT|nr:GAF domain-containing SpoIIE family protein phosphatase [Leptospira terpstrae]EMY61289.1 stage II sporulation protein E [Leptospira terpstrae serovar Hualin str. LT 11-33 = ATCC 700639]